MAGKGTNVDNLNFALIIDDSDFNKKIKADLKAANDFNTELSRLLSVQKELKTKTIVSATGVKNAERLNEVLKEIKGSMKDLPTSIKVFNDGTKDAPENMRKTNSELSRSRDLMSELGRLTGVVFGIAGVRSFVNSLVRVSGEFEVSKMALTSMLQDANKANVVFEQLKQNALASPYTFQDLTKYAKQLTAFNIDADQLVETEKRLADVAAGLGVDMQRIILAYGQVKSAGVLKGTELRQFTEAGVPLLQSLADQIERTEGKTISLSQVFDRISKKQIPFEMVEQAFKDMTSEGGKFYNMQEVLVETLQGKIGKLKDAWTQMLYAIGNQNGGILKGAVDVATNLVLNYEKFGWVVSGLIKTFGAYAAVLAVAAAGQKLLAGAEAIRSFMTLGKQIKSAATAMEAYAIASKAAMGVVGVIAAVGFGVYELVKHLNRASEATKRVDEATFNYNKTANEEISKLNLLRHTLENAKKGSDEWNDAKKEAVQNYGQYFNGLDNEITKVGNLETAYDNLVVAVKNSVAARTFSDFYQGESSSFEKAKDNFLKQVQKTTKEAQPEITQIALNEVRKYIDSHDITKDVSGFFSVLYKYNLSALTGGSYKVLSEAQQEFKKNTKELGERLGLSNGEAWNPDEYFANMMAGKKEIGGPTWTPPQGKGKTQAQKDIETTIDSVKDLQRAYKELIDAGFSTEDTNKIIDAGFEYLDASTRRRRDFWELLNELADELDRFDHEAAERLRADIGKGRAKESADAKKKEIKDNENRAKALADYMKVLRQWQNEDFNLGGTGFEFDVRKIASDYNTALGKIDEKYLSAVQEAEKAHAGNAVAIATETKRLGGLASAEMEYERIKAQEKINGLSKSYIDSQYKNKNISLDHLSEMSLRQIDILRGKIKSIKDDFLSISGKDLDILDSFGLDWKDPFVDIEGFLELENEDGDRLVDVLDEQTVSLIRLKGAALKAGLSFGDLKDGVDKTLQVVLKDLDEETRKKVTDMFSAVTSLSESFSGLAEAAGNGVLVKALSDIGSALSTATTAIAQFAKKNYFAAAATVISFFINKVAEAKRAERELASAIKKTNEEARRLSLSSALSEGTSNIFGENQLRKIRNSTNNIISLKGLTEGDKSIASSKLFGDTGVLRTLPSMIRELGLEMYDAYGNLNSESLQKILDTYKGLGSKEKEWIQSAIDNADAYKEAMDQLRDTMDGVFGDIADDAASKIVDHWKNMGDAALDYSDILDDVGTKYAEMIVRSMLLDKIFNKEMQDSLWEKFQNNDVEGAMSIIANGMDTIATLAPAIESALEPIRPYIKSASSSSDNTLKDGINKELVEGNSSLIASYMNAIRADVSVTRQDIHSYLPMIASDLHSYVGGPSLANYQAEVQAHLANIDEYNSQIAQSNAEMLRHIRSVITSSSSGGSAIRTTK